MSVQTYRERFPDATDTQLVNQRRREMCDAWSFEVLGEGRAGRVLFWGEHAVPEDWRATWYASHPLEASASTTQRPRSPHQQSAGETRVSNSEGVAR